MGKGYLKNALFIIVLLGFTAFGGWLGQTLVQPNLVTQPQQQVATESSTKNPSSEAEVTQPIGAPVELYIPKIGVQAPIESVGLDSEGRMDVPKVAANAGWFNQGYKPGEKGNAVIAGHLDSETGAPAIFWNLSQLNSGDEIVVKDEFGNNLRYVVTGKQTFVFNKVPLDEIFGGSDKSKLNLITCDGTFDYTSRNYSQRMVVYSELRS